MHYIERRIKTICYTVSLLLCIVPLHAQQKAEVFGGTALRIGAGYQGSAMFSIGASRVWISPQSGMFGAAHNSYAAAEINIGNNKPRYALKVGLEEGWGPFLAQASSSNT